MFSSYWASRQFFPLSRSRLRLHVNRDNAFEIVYHASTLTLNLAYRTLNHIYILEPKKWNNENNVEKSDHLHYLTPKREKYEVFSFCFIFLVRFETSKFSSKISYTNYDY